MPKVVFARAVGDRAHWASKHSERVDAFAVVGIECGRNYLSADGSNNVAVGVDVHDMAAMQAALASPEIETAKRPTESWSPLRYSSRKAEKRRLRRKPVGDALTNALAVAASNGS